MPKGPIQQDITTVNTYTPNNLKIFEAKKLHEAALFISTVKERA